jgi:hypothetical protein
MWTAPHGVELWNASELRVAKDLEGTGRDLTAVTIPAFVW